jgi:trk system potassium uptake protein TrkA
VRRFAVIGLGRFGFHLAKSLSERGAEVLAIDRSPKLIEEIKGLVTSAVCTDATSEENLRALSVDEMDDVLIAIGAESLESSILTTALVARLKVPHIIARATNDLHGQILRLVGAHEIVNPESDLAHRIAQRIARPAIIDLIQISEDGYSLSEITAPKRFNGKTLAQTNLRQEYGLNVLGIKRRTKRFNADGTEDVVEYVNHNPAPTDVIQDRDILICIGTIEDIENFAQIDQK